MLDPHDMTSQFAARFDGRKPAVLARAPGRVNLIGEHTDYNEGFALPAAINRYLRVAAAPRDDRRLRAFSAACDEHAELDPATADLAAIPAWMKYVVGAALALRDAGFDPPGADLLIHSDLPPGGGLASSAALTVACAKALTALGGGLFEMSEFVEICVAAESQCAGTPCGPLDPCACLMARPDSSFLLDCRTLIADYLPATPGDARFVLIDSGIAHANRAGQYAQRRRECHDAVTYFQQINPRITALRDVDDALLARHVQQLDPSSVARCHHVLAENRRARQAAAALRQADPATFGRLMTESHESLRDRFQASTPELDRLVELASAVPGVFGARMTGGGFGGNVLVLCRPDAVEALPAAVPDLAISVVETGEAADWQEL